MDCRFFVLLVLRSTVGQWRDLQRRKRRDRGWWPIPQTRDLVVMSSICMFPKKERKKKRSRREKKMSTKRQAGDDPTETTQQGVDV